MRVRVKSLGTLVAALLVTCLMLSPAQAGTKSWHISESNGEVSVETGSGVRAASRGQSLKAGDAVRTGASGRAVIVRGGEYVIVSPKSRVRITKPEETGAITQIFQSVGSALFRIDKKETPHFGVKTPYLAAVVKGTTFNVTVTESGATVQVTEGRVEVATLDGGASDMIVPGRIGRVDANDRQLLKVLGTDGKAIRSPLPATPVTTPEPNPSSETGTGESASIESAADGIGAETSDAAQANDFSKTADGNAGADFSGRIGSAINSEPVSIAIATGGLVSNGQTIDRIVNRNSSSGSGGGSNNSGPSGSAGSNADPKNDAPPGGNDDGVPTDKGGTPDDKGGPPDDKGGPPEDKGGPPDDKVGRPDDKGTPPDDKGGPPDDKGGPPDDKGGPPDDKGGRPDDKGGSPDDKGGPPDDKGGNRGRNPGEDPGGKGGGKSPRS